MAAAANLIPIPLPNAPLSSLPLPLPLPELLQSSFMLPMLPTNIRRHAAVAEDPCLAAMPPVPQPGGFARWVLTGS